MNEFPPRLPLTRSERWARVAIVGALGVAALGIYLVFPAGLKVCLWHQFTGLPCLFCGVTRASHCLLHADWAGVFYYNWLLLPVALLAGAAAAMAMAEAASGRARIDWMAGVPQRKRGWTFPLVLAAMLWALHIHDALTTPKPELLNPDAPVYAWLVKWAGYEPAQTEATHE